MGEPIVQDGGTAGLKQSIHCPLAGCSQYNPELPRTSSEAAAIQQREAGEAIEALER